MGDDDGPFRSGHYDFDATVAAGFRHFDRARRRRRLVVVGAVVLLLLSTAAGFFLGYN